jgi:hypothetical protein
MPHYAYHKTLCTTLYDDVVIVKRPEYEGDDYLLNFNGHSLPTGDEVRLESSSDTAYLHTKRNAFAQKDVNPSVFLNYVDDRPSLRFLCELDQLDATIYTVACERANGANYDSCISDVRKILDTSPTSRRAVLRFANPICEYTESTIIGRDVTCLSMIHYLEDHCKLIFRASDVKNEIIVDLLTINEFFLAPVYNNREYKVVVYASTAQGTDCFNQMTTKLSRMLDCT